MKRNLTPSRTNLKSLGAAPQRGEIWWVRLNPTLGAEIRKTRPCLVLSTNVVNQYRRTVVVIPLSTSPSGGPPLLVPLKCEGRIAVAVVDQIRAVAKERLLRPMQIVSAKEMKAIEEGVRAILEL